MTQLISLLPENLLCNIIFIAKESTTYVRSEEPDPVVIPQPVHNDREESLVILVCNADQLRTICHAGF